MTMGTVPTVTMSLLSRFCFCNRNGSLAPVHGDFVAGMQDGGGVAAADHGGDAAFPGDDGCVGERGADVGHDGGDFGENGGPAHVGGGGHQNLAL